MGPEPASRPPPPFPPLPRKETPIIISSGKFGYFGIRCFCLRYIAPPILANVLGFIGGELVPIQKWSKEGQGQIRPPKNWILHGESGRKKKTFDVPNVFVFKTANTATTIGCTCLEVYFCNCFNAYGMDEISVSPLNMANEGTVLISQLKVPGTSFNAN